MQLIEDNSFGQIFITDTDKKRVSSHKNHKPFT